MAKTKRLVAADLFSGGGGLTVGLKRAGFHVAAAVEQEMHAANTYEANHPRVQLFKKDIRKVRSIDLLRCAPGRKINLLAGCPPCQGFSSLTAKYKRPDPRNRLIDEMRRLIEGIRPSAVMMENVPGLAVKGRRRLDSFIKRLRKLGYIVDWQVVQVANYGLPQRRRRLVLLAGKGFKITFPSPLESKISNSTGGTVRSVLKGLPRPVTLDYAHENGGPERFNWHVVRNLAPQNLKRLRQARPGKTWSCIDKRLRPECHKERDVGFSNVYGRMRWGHPAPTITGGCTTLSKGRFGHPSQDRTISVREAALLQTFPSSYKLRTEYMDYACDVVGNALPCDFAEIAARACLTAMRAQEK